jgi:hypothetical protein
MTQQEKELATQDLLILLGKYLKMPSLDGKSDRQIYRKEMEKILAEIQKPS